MALQTAAAKVLVRASAASDWPDRWRPAIAYQQQTSPPPRKCGLQGILRQLSALVLPPRKIQTDFSAVESRLHSENPTVRSARRQPINGFYFTILLTTPQIFISTFGLHEEGCTLVNLNHQTA
jgi:hypothetical protein